MRYIMTFFMENDFLYGEKIFGIYQVFYKRLGKGI